MGAEGAVMKGGQPESPLLEPLVREYEASAVPGEDLHAVATTRHEDEEVAGVEILFPTALHDRGETIDALAEIHRLGSEEDPDRPGEQEHLL